MTTGDRFLVIAAVLSGLALVHGDGRAAPDEPAKCVNACQQVLKYKDCQTGKAYELKLDDCYPCYFGLCQERSNMPGGSCQKNESFRNKRQIKDVLEACSCDGQFFVQCGLGTAAGEWQEIWGDNYWTCIPVLKADDPLKIP